MIDDLLKLTEEARGSESLSNEQYSQWVNLFAEFRQYLNNPSKENRNFRDEFVNFTDNNNIFGSLRERKKMDNNYETSKSIYTLQINGMLRKYFEKEKV